MIFIQKKNSDEKIFFKLKKKRKPLVFILAFAPFGIIISSIFVVTCFQNWFLGKVSFDSDGCYMVTIFMMVTFVPLILIGILNYVTNNLVITNQKVFIRKAVSGSLIIVELDDIKYYQYSESEYKGFKYHYITFVLKNNTQHKTGNLFINNSNLSELINVLNTNINGGKPINKIDKKLVKQEKCNIKVFRNYIFLAIYYAPFFISIVMFILLVSGVNAKLGLQKNINIAGIIERKIVSKDSRSNSTCYELTVRELSSSKDYDIVIAKEIFDTLNENDNIIIRAKKGSLGIVYDEVIEKK